MFYFFKVLNNILLKGIMLFFFYLFFAYYLGRGLLSFLVALSALCVIQIIINMIKDKKGQSRDRSLEYEKIVDFYVKQLLLKTRISTSKFFGELFSKKYKTVTRSEFLILKDKEIDKTSYIVLPVFTTPKINGDYVRRAFILAKRHNIKKAVIMCNAFDKDAENVISGIKSVEIKLLDKYSVYKMMEQYNVFPAIEEETAGSPTKKKFRINFVLNKITASGFFYAALYLSFFSLIVPIKIYYLAAAGINLILGIVAEIVSSPKAPEVLI